MTASLRTVLVGMPAEIHDGQGRPDPWFSGFIKRPVTGPVELRRDNLVGDGQADRSVHGGPEKALLAYCGDHYPRWCAELQRDDLTDGAFGENFTVIGLDETEAAIGDRYRIGSAVIEVSQPRQPCWKLARRCRLPTMPALAIAHGWLGWYFRVLTPGVVSAGDPVVPVARPHPEWTIARINRIFFGDPATAAADLAPGLALSAMSAEFVAICQQRFSLPELRGQG